MDKPLHYRGV